MTRLLLGLIVRLTPPADREWLAGDIVEELELVRRSRGRAAARRWLIGECGRVLVWAPRHWIAARRRAAARPRVRGDGIMSGILQDLGYGSRLLRRSPGYAAMAIATLALGIGANTAMFAVVNAVLLKPLPFPDADRLMLAHLTEPNPERPQVSSDVIWSYPKYQTFVETQDVFDGTALFAPRELTLSDDREPEGVRGEIVTDRYFGLLGVEPVLGRTFSSEEAHQPGQAPVALIAHGLWTRRFGADPGVLGQAVRINGEPYAIAGVLPHGFSGLTGTAQIWVPLGTFEPRRLAPELAQLHSFRLLARRMDGVSEPAAATAVLAAGRRVDETHPATFSGVPWGARAVSLGDSRADPDVRRGSLLLLGAVAFVLLIACANLANLAGARALTRGREVAARIALGASRIRIARQFLTEGLLLASLGAAAGLALASMLLGAAAAWLPEPDIFFRTGVAPGTPRIAGADGLTRIGAATIGFDARTLAFTCTIAAVTAVLVSLLPALRASAIRPVDVMKTEGRAATDRGLQALGVRAALVAGQMALALVLLTGAGLLVRSASHLYAADIGISTSNLLSLRLHLAAPYTAETGSLLFARLQERIQAIPGVDSVGLANCAPVSGGCSRTSLSRSGELRPGDPVVGVHWITPDLLPALGMRLAAGRSFSDRDRMGQPRVVLVNETAARTFWPDGSPIGTRVVMGAGGLHEGGAEIVGVVSDVRYETIESAPQPDVYLPLAQSYQGRMFIYVRSALDTAALVSAIRHDVRTLDAALPLSDIKTLDDRVDDAMWRTRVSAWLLSAFGGLALLLTAIGIFGVMAQTVAQRTQEIGIRVALGAQRRDVLALLLRRATLVTAVGLAAGIGCALALTRLLTALLYGVEPHDPLTFAAVSALLAAVALAACYLPARRATRVDAVIALRTE